jgi:hypothetical protein
VTITTFMATDNVSSQKRQRRHRRERPGGLVAGKGGYELGTFHNGIQEVGYVILGGVSYDPTAEWGTLRANLTKMSGGDTRFYLHGKNLYFSEGRTYTHGCTTEPDQKVLRTMFKLDPHGVGEGARNGQIAVSVSGK